MTFPNDEFYKNTDAFNNGNGNSNDDDGTGSGTGSSGDGGLAFHDFLSSNPPPISPAEETRKIAEHKEKTKGLIELQKKLCDDRKESKTGRLLGDTYSMSQSTKVNYKKHPGLSPQFDSVDPQMNWDPSLNASQTNSEKKEELTYQLQMRQELQNENKLQNKNTFVPPKLRPS